MLIDMNSMSLGLVTEKADMIEPITTMNSDDLAGHEMGVAANTGKVGENMTNLAGISPMADENSSMVGMLKNTVDMNSDLISSFDGVITNNSDLIAPLEGRAEMNSDELALMMDKVGKNEDDIMKIGADVDTNVGKITENMMSLTSINDKFDSSIEPLVQSNL